MFAQYGEIEKMTDLFTLGAYFLFMVYGASTLFKHSRHQLHRVTAWVLVWWAFLIFDGYVGYLFDVTTPAGKLASAQYDRFANVLDMTVVVGVVMIGYALTYVRKVTVGLVSFHSIPYIIFLTAVLITDSDAWMMAAFGWTLFYSIAYIIYFYIQIKSYIARVHAVYSNDSSRDLSWLKTLIWVFFSMLIVWAIPSYFHIVGTYIIYYVSSVVLWWIALNKILKQQPVNIRYSIESETDALEAEDMVGGEVSVGIDTASSPEDCVDDPEDQDILDRRFAFAPRLEKLFVEEQIYLQSDLNINELARILGTNRAYLSAYLNSVKQMSFFDFVNNWRLRKAVQQLSSNMDTIDVVADNCGFNNTYSFRRVFVKSFGCTPTEWRHLTSEERNEKMKLLS